MAFYGYYPLPSNFYPGLQYPLAYNSYMRYSLPNPQFQPYLFSMFQSADLQKKIEMNSNVYNNQDQIKQQNEKIQNSSLMLKNEQKMPEKINNLIKINQKPKNRSRRLAHQIQRLYKCPFKNCSKSYGSEGSLSQHLRIKHPQYYAQFKIINKQKNDQENNLQPKQIDKN